MTNIEHIWPYIYFRCNVNIFNLYQYMLNDVHTTFTEYSIINQIC